MKFYNGDPDKGGKEVSFWNCATEGGMIKHFSKSGFVFNPTHNFELLKPIRLQLFEKFKLGFIDERRINEVETTDFELNCFYLAWLQHELIVVNKWLSQNPTISNQIEITKYQNFINTEIEKIKNHNATSTTPTY